MIPSPENVQGRWAFEADQAELFGRIVAGGQTLGDIAIRCDW
jgi:hypothetical protein